MLLSPVWAFNWAQWLLYHKAIFDGPNKLIFIDPSVATINVREDLYSAWKEWMIVSEQAGSAMKWAAAFSTVGGEPLPGDRNLGRTFFLINGWRIFLDHGIEFTGNLFTEEGESPFILDTGVQIATSIVSTLVEEVTGAVAASTLAQAVWDLAVSNINTVGSVGEALLDIRASQILLNTNVIAVTDSSTFQVDEASLAASYYDNHFIQVISGNNTATSLIDNWAASGTVTLTAPLPFTPVIGATAFILSRRHIGGGRVN